VTTATFIVRSPREAHEVISDLYRNHVKPHTAKGAACRITWETVNHHHRHQLRKLFHGVVLRDIAMQVWVQEVDTGMKGRRSKEMWKRFFADLFIEPTFEEYTVRATGEVKVRERRRSTEELSDDQFAEFLLQVMAHAAAEHGVEFTDQHEGESDDA
jgi:hypothetical protein